MRTKLPWGANQLEIDLPDEWRIIGEAQPKSFPPCVSIAEEFERAVSQPTGAAPLRERALAGKKVVVVVDDVTRPTPAHLFFPYLLRELERAGARRDSLLLLPALGVHRPMCESEMERKVGREGLRGLGWENHNARDAGRLAYLGETRAGTPVYLNRHLLEAELIVSVGSIEPHVLAGFGGGLKNLVPGCAGAETVAKNHLCGARGDPPARIGDGPEANPLRRDLEEAAQMLHRDVFLVNTVLNADQQIVKVFAGHAQLAHREGIELARAIYGVQVPEPADIVITDSSPLDTDLRQGAKCIGNVGAAVKEKGIILAFLRSIEGVGDFKLSGRSLPRPVMKALVRVMNDDGILSFLKYLRPDLEVEEKFLAFYSLQLLRRNEVLAYAPAILPEQARRLALFRMMRDPAEAIRLAAARAPRRPSVTIFPRGGVTFPIVRTGSGRREKPQS